MIAKLINYQSTDIPFFVKGSFFVITLINKMHLNSLLYIFSISLFIYIMALFWRDLPNQKK